MITTPTLPPLPKYHTLDVNGGMYLYAEHQMQPYALAAYQAGRDAGLDEAANVCHLLRCSDQFEPEIQDRMLDAAAIRIRALKSDAKESSNG